MPTDFRRTAERAIWGLVNDRYDLAGHTAGLTEDEAFRMSRAPDIGDPGSRLDNAIAYLTTPDFGPLYARYYTNSSLDSARRLTIVYDVVRPSAAQILDAGGNPFRIAPARPPSGSIEASGTLSPPVVASEINEAERLAELLHDEDRDGLTDVLAAILTGGPTLWVSKSPQLNTIEALVLLLPPELRQHFTFQSFTLKASSSVPRLTVADESLTAHKECRWQFTLPRERGQIPASARDAAKALLSLSQDTARQARARHTLSQQFADGALLHDNLLAHVEHLLRLDVFEIVSSQGQFAEGLRLLSMATSTAERRHMTTTLVARFSPSDWADGATDAIERFGEQGWLGLRRFAVTQFNLCPDESAQLGLLTQAIVTRRPASASSAEERGARTALAAIAAANNQVSEFVVLSSGQLNVDALEELGSKTDIVNRAAPRLTRLARAVFQDNTATVSNTAALLSALAAAAPINGRAINRAAHIGLTAVSRLLEGEGLRLTHEECVAVESALNTLWRQYPSIVEPGQSLQAFFQLATTSGSASADDVGRKAATALLDGDSGLTAAELIGWAQLFLARGKQSNSMYTRLAAFLECGKNLAGFAAGISTILPPVTPNSESGVLDPHWQRIAALADEAVMTPYFVMALAAEVERASDSDSVGSIVDACIALADQKVRLSAASGEPIIVALKEYRSRVGDTSDSIRLRVCCAAIESISDEHFADRIGDEIWSYDNTSSLRGRLWRLAGALRIVERIRPASEMGMLKERMQQHAEWKSGMPQSVVDLLSQFFRLPESGAQRAIWRRKLSGVQTAERR